MTAGKEGFLHFAFSGRKSPRRPHGPKPMFQKAGGYQAFKLRRALKNGNYRSSRVHKLFGKVWSN